MVNALKTRVIDELKLLFRRHPTYKNLEIYNRYLNLERVQEGIIVRNTTASRIPLAADNFQGNVYGFATLAKHSNFPGLSIEWVREDMEHLTTHHIKYDVSSQFQNFNTVITLPEQMVKGKTNLVFADNMKDVEVFVNNQKIAPQVVDGKNCTIVLSQAPHINSKVEVSYWVKNLTPAGVYQIEITKEEPEIHKFQFMVDCLLDKEDILIEEAKGYEQTARTSFFPIYKNSLILTENDLVMTLGTDYLLDEETGIITFISNNIPGEPETTVLTNSKIKASYRIKGLSSGPFDIPNFDYAHNMALPGIVLAFGRGVSLGDKQFVVVYPDRQLVSLEYSGKWEMTLSLDIYARDTVKIEEIIDLTTSYLNTYIKPELDAEGIALVDVSFGGESEEIFDEGTGDLYYKGSVDYNFLTEWIMHKPLLNSLSNMMMVSEDNTISEEIIIVPNKEGSDYEDIK